MPKKWCYNAKTGDIFGYTEAEGITDFPRGTFLAYGDFLTTGIGSRAAAETWANEWSACLKCKATRHGKPGELCPFCGTNLSAPQKL